ncbi:MAG: 4'-phosphopantetheinyl transferase superfamily protein [Lachnospiraceae bacterium]|nr:4'-phosphopantetheinyl transferase superfamily protein [Lachnospiraceae bacterium]MBQ5852450.1 4'-phosphopantetheinyl transferase superfamily protein [Lachnospiraceae bacterium]
MKIYAAKTSDSIILEKIIDMLDKDRQEKVLRFKNIEERNRSVCAGMLLRYAFLDCGYSKAQWSEVEIKYNQYGKPELKNYEKFCYSLSHSGKWVICVVDGQNVGTDIQKWQKWNINIAKRFFAHEEYERIIDKKDEDRDRMFFSIWSAKESFVKYTGRGIGAGIDQCVTDVELSKIVSDDRILNIRLYEDIPGYSLCVCSERQEFPDKICMFLIDETGNIVASDID